MDPEKYKHVWLGQLQTLCDTRVIRRWRAGTCYPELDRGYQPYWGADFSAGGDDPTVLVKCWTTPEGALYVEAEAYRTHCQVCEISTLFDSIEGSRDQIIRCDASLPLLISQLRRDGFKATAAIKGPGSVEAGINQLNNFSEIIINPRCKDTIEEASKYQWRQNPAGDILPKPVDAWNHCFDAIRYAIEPLTTGAAQAMKKRALAEMAAKLNRPILDEFAAQPYKGFIG